MGRWIFLSLFEKAFHVSDRDLKYYVSPWQALYYCGGRIPSEAGFYYGSALHVQYYQGRLIPEKVCLESLQSPFCKNMHTWCWPKVQTCFVKGSNLCKVGINEIKYSQATYRQPETTDNLKLAHRGCHGRQVGQRHFLFCQHKQCCMGYWNKSAVTKPHACVQGLTNIPTTNVYCTLLYKNFPGLGGFFIVAVTGFF